MYMYNYLAMYIITHKASTEPNTTPNLSPYSTPIVCPQTMQQMFRMAIYELKHGTTNNELHTASLGEGFHCEPCNTYKCIYTMSCD